MEHIIEMLAISYFDHFISLNHLNFIKFNQKNIIKVIYSIIDVNIKYLIKNIRL